MDYGAVDYSLSGKVAPPKDPCTHSNSSAPNTSILISTHELLYATFYTEDARVFEELHSLAQRILMNKFVPFTWVEPIKSNTQ